MSHNVYADLGFADSEQMLVKAGLVLAISDAIAVRKLTTKQAAKHVGIPVARFETILRGRFRDVDEAELLGCLRRLGHDVHVEIKPLDPLGTLPGQLVVRPIRMP